MSKPSIFSKDYAKEMKRRKRNIFLLIIIPIIGLTIFLTTGFNGLLSKGISIKNSILLNKSKDDTKAEKIKVAEAPKKIEESIKPQPGAEAPKEPQESVASNEVFPISLSDGQKIGIEYSISGAEKTIKGVSVGSNISYDISPSKKAIVIQSVKNQDMVYLDANRVSKDITRKSHTSTKGQVFLKDQQLAKKPNYIWSITPKFIDEENIAYVSELPWINENAVQFVWKVNLKDNTHIQANPVSGKSITFKNIGPKGLGAVVDGDEVFVTQLGEVIK